MLVCWSACFYVCIDTKFLTYFFCLYLDQPFTGSIIEKPAVQMIRQESSHLQVWKYSSFVRKNGWNTSDCPIYLWRRSNNNSNNFCYCQLSLIYIWLPTWFYMQVDFVDFHLQIKLYLLFFYEQSGTSQPGKKLSRFKATRQKQQ